MYDTTISVGDSPQVRSWLVADTLEYLTPEARLGIARQASAELRALLERPRRGREEWAPLSLFHEMLVAAAGVGGRGDLEECWGIGRFLAQHEGGAVRALAVKLLRPTAILSLAPSLWQVHYRNAGRAVTRVVGPSAVSLSVIDYPVPHRAHCLSVGGWVQGALELGRRRQIRVEKVSCRLEHAATCDYRIAWQD